MAVALVLSFVALASWGWRRGVFPEGGWAGAASDHISQYGSTVLLAYRGLDVWRKPLSDVCPEVAADWPYAAFPQAQRV